MQSAITISFPTSGPGDCLLCTVKDNDGISHTMLIDCGLLTKEIETIIVDDWKCKIDVLIATHIDDDHIKGIIQLLSNHKDISIGLILFNNIYHSENAKRILTEREVRLAANCAKYQDDKADVDYIISANQAITLSELIMSNESWCSAWKRDIISSDKTSTINIDELGFIHVISPNSKELFDFYQVFCNKFTSVLYEKYPEEGIKDEEKWLELCSDSNESFNNIEYSISSESISPDAFKIMAKKTSRIDSSPCNRSSLAFIWEINDKKILFLGDAAPDVVTEGLKCYKEHFRESLSFDAVKVSHHGSEANTTSELLDLINSDTFLFCGNTSNAPSVATIAKM